MIYSGIPQKRRAEPEFQMQAALIAWARNPAVLAKYPGINLLEGSLNGVKLSKAQAGKAKAAGMLKGSHDIKLPVPKGGFTGLSIELKAGKNKPTEEQIEHGEALIEQGWKVLYIWDDWEEVKEAIEQYMHMGPTDSFVVRGAIP
jgi:hypothetical protein